MNKKDFAQIVATIGSFLAPITGRIHWSCPPWVNYLCQQARTKPKQFWGSTLAVLVLLFVGGWSYQWYKNLPKPQLVSAKITTPKITPLAEDLIPEPLAIEFGRVNGSDFTTESVAPLKLIGKPVPEGINLTPSLPGQWQWESDSKLVFTPAQDWPAGTTYHINFASGTFAADEKMEHMEYSFATLPFVAKISKFKFYQDPIHAKVRQAVATVRFNYPVDPSSFENNTTILLQALKQGKLDLDAEHFKFTVTYDKHKRRAYVRSENLDLPEVARYLVLTVAAGVKSASDSAATQVAESKNLLIPDAASYFKVIQANAAIVRNDRDQPDQVLTVETSLGATEAALNKSLHAYILPQNYPATRSEGEIQNYQWQNPGEVTDAILALSTPLNKVTIPAEQNYANLHSYRINVATPRFIYVRIDKGMPGFGDFSLSKDYTTIIKVPDYPREIGFLHKGALLALSSEKKLSVTVRGLGAVKFEIARVLPDNLNQLITQTQGDFNNPYFLNQNFNQQNISQIFSEIQQFNNSDLSKQQYSALDLSKYLSNENNSLGPHGLFLLQAVGWDAVNNYALDVKASRLILMTDLGLLVKDNKDKTHDVFVQSITQGTPVANAMVAVLGKNGLPVLTRYTDVQGQANFPPLNDFIEDREPIAYLVSFGNDVSFIPYNNPGRQLNFSRYDIGGIYTEANDPSRLSAYLFSDRGIYRPGDQAHIGMIVKQSFAYPQPAGLPIEVTVNDPRGTTVFDQKYAVNDSGYMSFDLPTTATSPTGEYYINLYIVKDGHADSLLGSTSIRLAEFQPDRMRISAQFSTPITEGWLSPDDLKATVGLWNLYGAPAADRRISAKLLLSPQQVAFDQYADYVFADPLRTKDKKPKVFSDNLADVETDDKGQATFDLHLDRFEKATYELTFFAEGFESQGGRSVTTQLRALISPLRYLLGYKADGDLQYIKQNSTRQVSFIAINPELKQQAATDLKIQLHALQPVTTLVKKADGTYQYQSIIKSSLVSMQPFSIAAQGTDYPLPTQKIGDFDLTVVDKENTELSHVTFSIVGESQQALARNAELAVKLNKEEYNAGEDIELQITAPYTGGGLITIERDKVYASQWFKTDMTSSVQHIRIPGDFEGNGYVNVAFVRAWDSPELFISPLSYSVVPFTVTNAKHAVKIDIDTPSLARPGEPFSINYKTDKAGKIIVFAVDAGILQVAAYQTPNPLAFFFQKRALEVLTQQTVDQILPKFVQEQELSAVGGDDGEALLANQLNPFKRKTDLPVAFWSGIVDADPSWRQLHYTVPDYFSGTLTVMAVAVASDAVGSASKESQVRGYFVINPNVPTFVAPGDEFEVSASIANNVQDSGANAQVAVTLSASAGLEIIDKANETLAIAEGKEQTVHYRLRVKDLLGDAKVTFATSMGDKKGQMDANLSIRPASSYMTSLITGQSDERERTVSLERDLYPQYRKVDAAMSNNPLILITGLQRYLDNFPYGCTEQLTSKAMPLLALAEQPSFNQDKAVIEEKVASTMQMLGQRQMTSGGFSYWPGSGVNDSDTFASVYAMHFITEAKAQGYAVSNDVFYNGMSYLKELVAKTPDNLDQARIQAYAIYLLTRNEVVTTNYLTNLQLYLEKEQADMWREDIIGAYMAASYALLKSEAEAEQLIVQYHPPVNTSTSDFYSKSIANAQYLYLLANHFPEQLAKQENKYILPLVNALNTSEMNTVLAGYSSLALGAYARSLEVSAPSGFSMTETLADKQLKTLVADNQAFLQAQVDEGSKAVTFSNPQQQNYFYQVSQAGFDRQPPSTDLKQGIEVYREYRDAKGNVLDSVPLGKEIEVHIQARALQDGYYSNIAIVDLLPGGFEVVRDSVNNQAVDYADAREDRVVFFIGLGTQASEIVYRIKAINNGEYTVPPIFAQAMYTPNIQSYSSAGKISVVAP